MKKITLMLAFIGMITLQSCTVNDNTNDVDRDTISEVWEYSNVNFNPNSYSVVLNFPHSIYTSDMVLMYRLNGVTNQGTDIWKLMPESYFFDDGTLDFRFVNDFTRFDAEVRLEGYNLAGLNANIRFNQVIRVVVVPGFFGNRIANEVDFSDYNKTIKEFKIDESKVQKFNLK